MALLSKPKQGRPSGPSRMRSSTRQATTAECIIIGAGHAGLSVARGLQQNGVEPILIEQLPAIGDAWRNRYERLHLHHLTDAMHLPGVKFPAHVPRYPSRLDLADYLEAYAALHRLDVRLSHRVLRLSKAGDGWQLLVQTPDSDTPIEFSAGQVVLAAGATGITPHVPSIRGSDRWSGQIIHSQNYVNAEPFVGKRVLVVGTGNSAIEILCDLHDHGARPSLLARSSNSWVTREGFANYHRLLARGTTILKYVPFAWLLAPVVLRALDHYLMIDVKRRYGDLTEIGIATDPSPPMLRMAKTRGAKAPSYIDGTWGDVGVSIINLIRHGDVPLYQAEIEHLEPNQRTVTFTDGDTAVFDTVLLCTGFEHVVTHYGSFLDAKIMGSLTQKGLQPWSEIPGQSGLWPALGGIATSRYALQILAARVAAKIQNTPPPARVLSPALSFLLGGPDPGLIQIPRRTVTIHLLALAVLAALALT